MVSDRPNQLTKSRGEDPFRRDYRTQISEFPAGFWHANGHQPPIYRLPGEGHADSNPWVGIFKEFPGNAVVEEAIQVRERNIYRHLGDLFGGRNLEQRGRHAQPFTALASASARLVRSHVASASVRPKCPRVENCR